MSALIYGGMARKGFSGAFSLGVDSKSDLLQAATIQANYNWDCCGIAFQYCPLGLQCPQQRKRLSLLVQPHQHRNLWQH